jgi:hypothetical protein
VSGVPVLRHEGVEGGVISIEARKVTASSVLRLDS